MESHPPVLLHGSAPQWPPSGHVPCPSIPPTGQKGWTVLLHEWLVTSAHMALHTWLNHCCGKPEQFHNFILRHPRHPITAQSPSAVHQRECQGMTMRHSTPTTQGQISSKPHLKLAYLLLLLLAHSSIVPVPQRCHLLADRAQHHPSRCCSSRSSLLTHDQQHLGRCAIGHTSSSCCIG